MKAKLHDREVCPVCNGTGYEIVTIKGRTYAKPCYEPVRPVLPFPEDEEQVA